MDRLLRMKWSTRRMMLAVAAAAFLCVPINCIWHWQGMTLPSLRALRPGMTKAEALAIVGPPDSEGEREDGSSWWTITRDGSFYWVELEFRPDGRLWVFRYECF